MAGDHPQRETDGAAPPGRGEQTHETMHAAATSTVAHDDQHTPEPIPGERDATTLTARLPGAIGRSPAQELPPVAADAGLTKEDIEELRRDGGGAPRDRKTRD
jgi:hypothetical protein